MTDVTPRSLPRSTVGPLIARPPVLPDEAVAIRRFCLETIQEAFGHGYRPDWHSDLDRLGSANDDYTPERGGAFLVVGHQGTVVACGGLRPLSAKPTLSRQFETRYPDPTAIGSLWRVYVQPDLRGRGLGRLLNDQLEAIAMAHGYRTLYLHTSAQRHDTVAFWQRQGYQAFCHELAEPDSTLHLDKTLT